MIKAAVASVSRQSATPDHELTSYFTKHQYSESRSRPFEADATTSPSPSTSRSKLADPPSPTSKRHRVDKYSSIDSSTIVPERNPSNSDWNSRRRSDVTVFASEASSQRNAVDPPRPAKDGMEWVWFPVGYWAERARVEIGPRREESLRKWFNRSPSFPSRRTSSSQKKPDLVTHSSQSLEVPSLGYAMRKSTGTSGTSKGSESESRLGKLRVGFSYMSPTYPHFISPSGEPEGLYCKTKRSVEGKLVPRRKLSLNEGSPYSKIASQTTMLLEGASSYFEESQSKKRIRAQIEAASPISPASPGPGSRRFGLAPWHRRTSFDSSFSVTSSVHRLLRGKTPQATPDAVSVYSGQDTLYYPKSDMLDATGSVPNFLPSEAIRINTPPMSPGTPEMIPRGFFFALTPPGQESKSPIGSGSGSRSCDTGSGNGSKSQNSSTPSDTLTLGSKEWWETDPRHPSTPGKSTRKPISKVRTGPPAIPTAPLPKSPFVLNLPEHLPSSPLCPKHPNYIGKLNGVCVYHGRKRSVSLRDLKDRLNSVDTIAASIKGEYEM